MTSFDRDADLHALLAKLHEHLAATGSLELDAETNRWLGEAEAVAADVAGGDAPRGAVRTRVEQVLDLLGHVEDLDDPEAEKHVAAARDLAEAILTRLSNQ